MWTWKTFVEAWQSPKPPSGKCLKCGGHGKRSSFYVGIPESSCDLCQGVGSTAPPVLRYERCDCNGGERLSDIWIVECWHCHGRGEIVEFEPWNPPERKERLLRWLLRKEPWKPTKRAD